MPILGLVENMSVHICSNCGHAEPILAKAARQNGRAIRGDRAGPTAAGFVHPFERRPGKPSVAAEPDGEIARRYQAIARQVAIRVAERARDFSSRIPKIVIQNT